MTGCCVPGCRNTSEERYYMKRFPRDEEKKKFWMEQIGRGPWKPKQYSAICEVSVIVSNKITDKICSSFGLICRSILRKTRGKNHGRMGKKLKSQALPTIFVNNDANRGIASATVINTEDIHLQQHLVPPTENIHNKETTNAAMSLTSSTLKCATDQITLLQQLELKEIEVQQMKKQLEDANQVVLKCNRMQKTLMNRIRRYRSANRLPIEKHVVQSRQLLEKVFNDDQIQWLQSNSSRRRVYKWSKETIKKTLRIRFSCTNTGDQELIEQNISLPSIRTLRESLEGFDFGLLDGVFI